MGLTLRRERWVGQTRSPVQVCQTLSHLPEQKAVRMLNLPAAQSLHLQVGRMVFSLAVVDQKETQQPPENRKGWVSGQGPQADRNRQQLAAAWEMRQTAVVVGGDSEKHLALIQTDHRPLPVRLLLLLLVPMEVRCFLPGRYQSDWDVFSPRRGRIGLRPGYCSMCAESAVGHSDRGFGYRRANG